MSQKYFTEHLPATFAYAGIGVRGRLSGVRGAQILGCGVVIGTGPVPLAMTACRIMRCGSRTK